MRKGAKGCGVALTIEVAAYVSKGGREHLADGVRRESSK
jgi:hypothetical protein